MYEELLKAAIAYDAPQKALFDLADWLRDNSPESWNGESWDISDIGAPSGSRSLVPVFDFEDENGDFPIIGYEIR